VTTTDSLVSEYLTTTIAWDRAQNDAKKANPLFERLHVIFKQLREVEPGRNGIAELMDHGSVGVRLMAASHSLAWAPEKAAAVLDKIAAGPGLHAVTAKYTLKSFREGNLNMDW